MIDMDQKRVFAIRPADPHDTDDPSFSISILIYRSFYALCEFYGLTIVSGQNEYGSATVTFMNLEWKGEVYPCFAECDDPGIVESFVLFCKKDQWSTFQREIIDFFDLSKDDYMLFDDRGEWVV